MITKQTPSMFKHPKLPVISMALMYLGHRELNDEILSIYETNEHALLLDSQTRKKYEAILNVHLSLE
jgi:hypothetical protein